MIHVKEQKIDEDTTMIDVSGVLNDETVPILRSVCRRHLDRGSKLAMNLERITHITRDGRSFLQDIRDSVEFVHVPEFINTDAFSNK